jgi:hypothetical protein
MSKKTIKGGKAKKQVQEKRYFTGVLLTIGGLFVIGLAALVLFGGNFKLIEGPGGGHDSEIVADMESKHGAAWRELGFVSWKDSRDFTWFYVDSGSWYQKPEDEQREAMEQVGQEFYKIADAHGGKNSAHYIMFHDEREVMFGIYTKSEGAQIQK